MNERIQALMEQAMELVDPYALEGEFGPRRLNEEKFAELIVDECCLKLLHMDDNTGGNHNYYKHAALEVKRHFMVER